MWWNTQKHTTLSEQFQYSIAKSKEDANIDTPNTAIYIMYALRQTIGTSNDLKVNLMA